MNISGKVSNVNSSGVVGYAYLTSSLLVNKDKFEKDKVSSKPSKYNSGLNPTGDVSGYSPKQLLSAYSTPAYVKHLADSNPKVSKLLNSAGIDVKIYPDNISKTSHSHITATTAIALQIANTMGISSYDKHILEQACVFHDYGKVLIPSEIINKPGNLSPEERNIMNLHSQLGYELLSNTKINKRVLDLVKNHHKPETQKDDVLNQILSVADIYSALREQRSYKRPLTNKETFEILDQKAKMGEVSTEVVEALKSCISPSYCVA